MMRLWQNRQSMPLDSVVPVWQYRTTMSGTENQFSLNRTALGRCGRG
jgi:hypothetical protein